MRRGPLLASSSDPVASVVTAVWLSSVPWLRTHRAGNVSRLEGRSDVYLSTLRSYVEALGGHLEIAAVFPDERVAIAVGPEHRENTQSTVIELLCCAARRHVATSPAAP